MNDIIFGMAIGYIMSGFVTFTIYGFGPITLTGNQFLMIWIATAGLLCVVHEFMNRWRKL